MALASDNLLINISDASTFKTKTRKFKKKVLNTESSVSSPVKEIGADAKVKVIAGESASPSHRKQRDPFIRQKPTSSLFKHNPDIPVVNIKSVNVKQEPLFSTADFTELSLHPHLTSCLRDKLNVTCMTSVQEKTIPQLLQGNDALVKSLTGSGKTLAYAVPIVQTLQAQEPKLQRSDGIHALIILPTRELAVQSYECFVHLCRAFTWIVPGCLMGGEKKKSEKARIRKGITILVTTPGRLLDHLDNTSNLNLQFIKWLIIDEADRLMELGFEETISKILAKIEEKSLTTRQTVLLSATLNQDVQSMAGLTLKNPVMIDIAHESSETSMKNSGFSLPNNLKQHLLFVPVKLRLVALSCFLIDKCATGKLKALIFVSAQDVVDFHFEILSEVLSTELEKCGLEIKFFRLHGNMKQQERIQVFRDFRETETGVLICTDVAARGLDLPKVDWIVQYNPPSSFEDYIHRIGRTARIGTKGNSLIFLLPSEKAFLGLIQEQEISIAELTLDCVLPSAKLLLPAIEARGKRCPRTVEEYGTALQDLYEQAVSSNDHLLELARKGCLALVRSYISYPKAMREILPFRALHLGHVAKSFCLQETPTELASNMLNAQGNSERFSREQTFERPRYKQQWKRSAPVSEFDSGLANVPKPKKKKYTSK